MHVNSRLSLFAGLGFETERANMKPIIICGHYGCGKTNYSIHLAGQLNQQGVKTALVDLDVVNPYFRSSDYGNIASLRGVKVIAPTSAGTTIDAPCLPPEIFSVFDGDYGAAVFDVGGDDAGATALGQFAARICEQPYEMIYVINRYRSQVADTAGAVEILREIEAASRLKATGILNNSHLSGLTTAEDILASLDYANRVAAACALPLTGTTAPEALAPQLAGVQNLIPLPIVVKPPW